MTEILTESFCERCGTRYTFESARPRTSRLARARTFTKGVRNFVLSEDSFSEAMADARSEDEIAATSHQLDAFHRTFNFCLTCRQYTCGNCWNVAEGRCLTCAPLPEAEAPELPAAAVLQAPEAGRVEVPSLALPPAPDELAAIAWPEVDLSSAHAPHAAGPAIELEPTEPGEIEIEGAVPPPEAATPEVVAAIEPEPIVAEAAASGLAEPIEATVHVSGLEPGQSLEDAIAAYEARVAVDEALLAAPPEATMAEPEAVAVVEPEAVAVVEPEAVAVVEPEAVAVVEPEAVAVVEPEAVAVEPEPVAVEPEPVAVEPEPVAVEPEPVEPEPVAVEPEPVAVEPVAVEPVAVEPVAPVAPVTPPVPVSPTAPTPIEPVSPWLTVAPDDGAGPQWPSAPVWPVPGSHREVPGTLAGRPLLPQGDAGALWAASAREVLGSQLAAPQVAAAATPQPCVGCGLSLSASARFCRRCGARQG